MFLSFAGCAKQPTFKKLPKPSGTPTQQEKEEMPQTEAPEKQTPEPTRTNVKPSTADELTPQRQASMKLVDRGKSLMNANDYDRAAGAFRDAVSVDTTNGVAYFWLAQAEVDLGHPELAIGLLDKAEALLGADAEWMKKIDDLKAVVFP